MVLSHSTVRPQKDTECNASILYLVVDLNAGLTVPGGVLMREPIHLSILRQGSNERQIKGK